MRMHTYIKEKCDPGDGCLFSNITQMGNVCISHCQMIKESIGTIGTDPPLMHFLEAMVCTVNWLKSCSLGITLNIKRRVATGLSLYKIVHAILLKFVHSLELLISLLFVGSHKPNIHLSISLWICSEGSCCSFSTLLHNHHHLSNSLAAVLI